VNTLLGIDAFDGETCRNERFSHCQGVKHFESRTSAVADRTHVDPGG
jgi:hypothetical protein